MTQHHTPPPGTPAGGLPTATANRRTGVVVLACLAVAVCGCGYLSGMFTAVFLLPR